MQGHQFGSAAFDASRQAARASDEDHDSGNPSFWGDALVEIEVNGVLRYARVNGVSHTSHIEWDGPVYDASERRRPCHRVVVTCEPIETAQEDDAHWALRTLQDLVYNR